MWFFYFLPMLVAIGFLLFRASRGGSSSAKASWPQVAVGLFAVVVLGLTGGALWAGLWR